MAARKNIYGNAFDKIKALRASLRTPEFLGGGSCVGKNPKLWDDDDKSLAFQAKSICAGCPMLALCREWGMDNELYGIWGGMTESERRKARKAAGVRFIPLEDRIADVEWMEDVVRMTAAELTAKYGVSDRQGFRWKRLVA